MVDMSPIKERKRIWNKLEWMDKRNTLSFWYYVSHILDPNCIFSFMTFVDSIKLLFLQILIISKVLFHVLHHLIHEITIIKVEKNALHPLVGIKAKRSDTYRSACLELKLRELCCNHRETFLGQEESLPEENVAGFTRIFSCLHRKKQKYLYAKKFANLAEKPKEHCSPKSSAQQVNDMMIFAQRV